MKRISKIKDPSPLCFTVSAKKYLTFYRNWGPEYYKQLSDVLIKIVDAHKARDALSTAEIDDPSVKFLIEEGLRHLRLAEHFFYRAYENDYIAREEK